MNHVQIVMLQNLPSRKKLQEENGQKSAKTDLNNEQMVKTLWMLAKTEAKGPGKGLRSLGQFLH